MEQARSRAANGAIGAPELLAPEDSGIFFGFAFGMAAQMCALLLVHISTSGW
jgi:hypothetical protein